MASIGSFGHSGTQNISTASLETFKVIVCTCYFFDTISRLCAKFVYWACFLPVVVLTETAQCQKRISHLLLSSSLSSFASLPGNPRLPRDCITVLDITSVNEGPPREGPPN